jgi:hypothetical protein
MKLNSDAPAPAQAGAGQWPFNGMEVPMKEQLKVREVTIFSNTAEDREKWFTGFRPDHWPHCKFAWSFQVATLKVKKAAELAFHLTNAPEEILLCDIGDQRYGPDVTMANIRKFHQHFHSLSVGDVVLVDDQFFACARRGWDNVTAAIEAYMALAELED